MGFLRYLDTNEQISYTDPDAYIAAYKETWIKNHSNQIQEALREQARSEPDAEQEL